LGLPILGFHEAGKIDAPAGPVAAAFHPPVLFDDDRDIDADQGTDVRGAFAVRAHDLYCRPFTGKGGGDLLDARVFGSRIGVDLTQDADLVVE